jgi:ELWxxDGT repeat protein
MSMLFAGGLIAAPSALAAEKTPVLVKDIDTRTLNGFADDKEPYFAELGGLLYFNANNTLWQTDGTEAVTQIVESSCSLEDIIAFKEKLYLEADDGQGAGSQLWVSNGTSAGTSLLKIIGPGGSGASISRFTVVGDAIFFEGNTIEIAGYKITVNKALRGSDIVSISKILDWIPGQEAKYVCLTMENRIMNDANRKQCTIG